MTRKQHDRRVRASPPRPVLLGDDSSSSVRQKRSYVKASRIDDSDSDSGCDNDNGSGSGSGSGTASSYRGQRRKFRDYSHKGRDYGYKGKSYADLDSASTSESKCDAESQSRSCSASGQDDSFPSSTGSGSQTKTKSQSRCPSESQSQSQSQKFNGSGSDTGSKSGKCDISVSCDAETTINSASSSSSCGTCPVAKSIRVQAGKSYQRTLKYQRAKDECGEPVTYTCKRDTEYVFRIPNGVSTVVVTAIGGGGAGGSRLAGETASDVPVASMVSNGAGGQAGSSFINVPIDVKPGQELIFSVGAGGNPPSRQQINVSNSTESGNFAPSIVDGTYSGVLERSGCEDDCKYRDQLLTLAGGQGAVLDDTQGAPTVIRLRDECGVETIKVVADGGLSGNQVVNPIFDPYIITGRYNAGNTNYGAPGDVISSGSGAGLPPSPDYPTAYGALPSQGGSSPFGPGGNAMVTPANGFFEQTVQAGVPIFSYFPINQQACPDGVLGSGGAGATIRFPAGRGGDGFVTFSFTEDDC